LSMQNRRSDLVSHVLAKPDPPGRRECFGARKVAHRIVPTFRMPAFASVRPGM
jgi:hypothetical protein